MQTFVSYSISGIQYSNLSEGLTTAYTEILQYGTAQMQLHSQVLVSSKALEILLKV